MSSERLAKNTVALFVRQIIVLAINLYSVRALLSALGIEDFALFNVIVNVVAIGSFLPSALGMITQRFFSFAIGKGEGAALKRVYDASLMLCACITLLIVLGLETIGPWFIAHHLVVDAERTFAAQVLFQLSVVSFVAANFSGLYSSIVVAHEDMHVLAIFSVIDAVLRLAAVLCIGLLAGDELIMYGLLLCGVSFFSLAAYWIYCNRRYAECRSGRIDLEMVTIREMLGFAGWTAFGQLTTVSRNQAVTILINQAFNPATVAARVLATTVSTQALTFSNNFSSALHPPIIKTYAAGEKAQMFELIFTGSKITFFMIWVATLPLIALMPVILSLWLGSYPNEAVLFTRLALVENAIMAISVPLMTAVRATGQIRLYEISLGALQILVLLLSWLLILAGYPAHSIYLVAIAINLSMFAVRLAIVSNLTGLPAGAYLRRVVFPVLAVVGVSSGLVLAIITLVPVAEVLSLVPGALGAAALICLLPAFIIYTLGLTGSERQVLNGVIRRQLAKFGIRQSISLP